MNAAPPRLLDLFCGAGGAAMGYHQAGFDVVGVDIKPQPHYPFEFIEAEAIGWVESGAWQIALAFDPIPASPPCQAYSKLAAMHPRVSWPALIEPVRELLQRTGL